MKPFTFSVALTLLLSLASPGVAHQSASPTLLQNAQALMKEGRMSEALPLLLEVHRVQPRNPSVCQQLGIAYTQLQQFTEAAQFYRRALSINPQILPARKNLGVVLWFAGWRMEAEREFRQVLTVSPNDPFLPWNAGARATEA
jgi:Flp pilus assembly protein TadD